MTGTASFRGARVTPEPRTPVLRGVSSSEGAQSVCTQSFTPGHVCRCMGARKLSRLGPAWLLSPLKSGFPGPCLCGQRDSSPRPTQAPGVTQPLSFHSCVPGLCPGVLHSDTAASRPPCPQIVDLPARGHRARPSQAVRPHLRGSRKEDFMVEDWEESQPRRACLSLGNEPTPIQGSWVDSLRDHSPGLPPVHWWAGHQDALAQPQVRSSQRQGPRSTSGPRPACALQPRPKPVRTQTAPIRTQNGHSACPLPVSWRCCKRMPGG